MVSLSELMKRHVPIPTTGSELFSFVRPWLPAGKLQRDGMFNAVLINDEEPAIPTLIIVPIG